MIFIGFSGRARNGKTECTLAVMAHATLIGRRAQVYDVGDMIRCMAIEQGRLPNVERADMNTAQIQVLIDLGKEMRAIDNNYWLDRIIQQAKRDNPDLAMCPNVRLPQEAQSIRDVGGVIVRVTRLNKDGSPYISLDRNPNDITETALNFWPADFYLTLTDGGVRLLRRQAVGLYDYLSYPASSEVRTNG